MQVRDLELSALEVQFGTLLVENKLKSQSYEP